MEKVDSFVLLIKLATSFFVFQLALIQSEKSKVPFGSQFSI